MQERPLETTELRKLRIDVNRVSVTTEPVQRSLLRTGNILDDMVRLTLRRQNRRLFG